MSKKIKTICSICGGTAEVPKNLYLENHKYACSVCGTLLAQGFTQKEIAKTHGKIFKDEFQKKR